jgi:hypothetical protein
LEEFIEKGLFLQFLILNGISGAWRSAGVRATPFALESCFENFGR